MRVRERQSGAGARARSKTCRHVGGALATRSVVECGTPFRFAYETGALGVTRRILSHAQTERDLKFLLKFFLDRQVRADKMLLSAFPSLNADRSGWISVSACFPGL
jgi:hypothetical protein